MCPRYCTLTVATLTLAAAVAMSGQDRVKMASGIIEGTGPQPSGIRQFKGIPFAQPPVGQLRWKPAQPVNHWTGVRDTTQFGPRCMQPPLFSDMKFRSDGMSEDCLYLNVWTPAKSAAERLPVLVYFFGGGFAAGDGSEYRYDGESMARKGIVTVTVNYRLGAFGFLAHPGLTKESPHHASGNYALFDQHAALVWARENIAAFGGDPRKITIAGESAGSIAVSAQMASPLSRDLIAGAIGESGSIVAALAPVPLDKAEAVGVKFASAAGVSDIAGLRAMSAEQILGVAGKFDSEGFPPTLDGYFFTESPRASFEAGKQSHVPLLAGWNTQEGGPEGILRSDPPTVANYEKAVRRMYGSDAEKVLKEYAAANDADVLQVATDLSGDNFIAYSTWKWIDTCATTGGKPVYRYLYAHPRPRMIAEAGGNPSEPPAPGAVHSAEIEYALGNLDVNKLYEWAPDDYKVSPIIQEYFANFIKTGNPNGKGLPNWPAAKGGEASPLMRIDVDTHAETETHRGRYLLQDRLAAKR